MTEKRAKRTYDEKFKKQLVQLYNNGNARAENIKEYDLTPSAFDKWLNRINTTGSSGKQITEARSSKSYCDFGKKILG